MGSRTALARERLPSQREWSHGILVAVSLLPLTFGSRGAHLSFLPWGAWNGSISCRETRLASDKGSPWSLGGKGLCSEKHRKGEVQLGPTRRKRFRIYQIFSLSSVDNWKFFRKHLTPCRKVSVAKAITGCPYFGKSP